MAGKVTTLHAGLVMEYDDDGTPIRPAGYQPSQDGGTVWTPQSGRRRMGEHDPEDDRPRPAAQQELVERIAGDSQAEETNNDDEAFGTHPATSAPASSFLPEGNVFTLPRVRPVEFDALRSSLILAFAANREDYFACLSHGQHLYDQAIRDDVELLLEEGELAEVAAYAHARDLVAPVIQELEQLEMEKEQLTLDLKRNLAGAGTKRKGADHAKEISRLRNALNNIEKEIGSTKDGLTLLQEQSKEAEKKLRKRIIDMTQASVMPAKHSISDRLLDLQTRILLAIRPVLPEMAALLVASQRVPDGRSTGERIAREFVAKLDKAAQVNAVQPAEPDQAQAAETVDAAEPATA